MTLWMPNKKKPLYAPMLATFGGGSVRGFKGAGGGVDTAKRILGYGFDRFNGGGASASTSTQYWHSDTQAGDLGIVVVGFAGYDTGGASNATSINIPNRLAGGGQWGSNATGTDYYAQYYYKVLTSTDISNGFVLSTTNAVVADYGTFTYFSVRNAGTPYFSSVNAFNNFGTGTGNFYQGNSGSLPSTVNNASDDILIEVVTTRSGDNIFTDTSETPPDFVVKGQVEDYQDSGVMRTAAYEISYGTWSALSISKMKIRYQADGTGYDLGSIVISV